MFENTRLNVLLRMLEEHLRRPLSPEERRLISLTEPWTDLTDEEPLPKAAGESPE